ncbi:MAG: outer membrane protein assembly factor BamE [Rhodocyclaceae bacterium]|jgi:outer membrane protein assembly factor BamE|nr:outer membrane protein assembly factor BamE [Rhodocyclaceae bacterium]
MRIPSPVATLASCLLAACSLPATVADNLHPYRIDIRQGNHVDQGMVSQLRKGMTRDQVRFVLGTPLLTDVFHADRWDYLYRFAPGSGDLEQRRIAVFFQDGKLDHVEGDVVAGMGGPGEMAEARSRVIDLMEPVKSDK